eukprot:9947361-Alexandrium_andersonii.AAC.1
MQKKGRHPCPRGLLLPRGYVDLLNNGNEQWRNPCCRGHKPRHRLPCSSGGPNREFGGMTQTESSEA